MMKRTSIYAALCGWLMASGSLLAHHSLAASYDVKKEMELAGEVEADQVFKSPTARLRSRSRMRTVQLLSGY